MLVFGLKFFLGIILWAVSLVSLLANIIVARPVFSFVLDKDKSSIYVLAAFSILHDICQMLLSVFYLAPCMITNSFILSEFRGGAAPLFFGTIYLTWWNIGNWTQILIAVNRALVICYRRGSFFTKRNLLLMLLTIAIFSTIKVYSTQYLLPCCSFIIDQSVYSYSYYHRGDIPNYLEISELPLNCATSVTTFTCYAMIFKHIRDAQKTAQLEVKSDEQKKRRKREFSHAIQFSFISIPYTFGWILFRLFPMLIADRGVEWYYITAIANTLNCSANAFIYLVFNAEVKRNLGIWLTASNKVVHSTSMRSSSVDPNSNKISTTAKPAVNETNGE